MIDLHYWPTPNGWKVAILLEKTRLPYRLVPVNLRKGEQNAACYAIINPNQRVPVIVDREADCAPVTLAESGAILFYFAEKSGQFLPREPAAKYEVLQWVMWQMSALGPALGQAKHFRDVATGKSDYATERFAAEANCLYDATDRCLADRAFLAGASVA